MIDETGLKVEDIHLWFWFIIDPEKQKTVVRDHLTLYGLSLVFYERGVDIKNEFKKSTISSAGGYSAMLKLTAP